MGDLGDLCCFYPHGVQIIETVILEAGQYDQGPLSYTTNLKCASNRASFTLCLDLAIWHLPSFFSHQ